MGLISTIIHTQIHNIEAALVSITNNKDCSQAIGGLHLEDYEGRQLPDDPQEVFVASCHQGGVGLTNIQMRADSLLTKALLKGLSGDRGTIFQQVLQFWMGVSLQNILPGGADSPQSMFRHVLFEYCVLSLYCKVCTRPLLRGSSLLAQEAT